MYFIKRKILRTIFSLLGKKPTDMPMVKYWKTKLAVAAKVTTNKDGALVMQMEGEDEIFPGFPRSHTLYGTLSKLKHEIKNQIFNDAWKMLEEGKPKEEVVAMIKEKVTGGLQDFIDICRYDMVPPEKMFMPVREIWRVLSILEKEEPRLKWLKEALTYVLQEDDAYRMRVQWIIQIFNPRSWFCFDPVKDFDLALSELEHAEVIGDMKERQRLLRRILLLILEDKKIRSLFLRFCKEVDWNKLKLTNADKYHFRAKYFRVDLDKFEY